MNTRSHAAEPAAARWAIALASLLVVLGVALVMAVSPAASAVTSGPTVLARLNVVLNAAAGVLLMAGFALVRAGHVTWHRRCMLAAFGVSSAFLVSYLLHHAQVGSVPFRGTGWVRAVYFAILVPHIVLAAGIVPLALFTVYRAWTGKVAAHRKIAKVTLPLWLFVSLSGVAVYLLLYHLPV